MISPSTLLQKVLLKVITQSQRELGIRITIKKKLLKKILHQLLFCFSCEVNIRYKTLQGTCYRYKGSNLCLHSWRSEDLSSTIMMIQVLLLSSDKTRHKASFLNTKTLVSEQNCTKLPSISLAGGEKQTQVFGSLQEI